MFGANPSMDVAVLFLMLGPVYLRWPVILLPLGGAIAASFISTEWWTTLQQVTIPAIFITLAGYMVAVLVKALSPTS
ncbi:MAG TPA: hypothetical protein VF960_11645 [Chloroflexota bacterium]